MKKVRTSIAMLGFPSASVLELPDADAASLIAAGFAVPSSEPAMNVAAPEAAQAAPEPELEAEPELETADAPAAAEAAVVKPARKAPARKAPARKGSSS